MGKQAFVVQYLTQNRHGGLEDREVVVTAADENEAIAIVQARHQHAEVHYAEPVSA